MSSQDILLNNRYQLLSQYGSGGMSVIYKAVDLALGREVAIKILRPSMTDNPDFLSRFRLEARNAANLQHPNIVTVHDVGQDGNTHFIVMELIEGQDLKRAIRAEAPFAIDRMLTTAIKICAAIGYAHRAGIVHADVKPQNVLLEGVDNVKVTDFGIAQALATTNPQERHKVVWGSPHYFSPEQAQGMNPSPASDVYSIGVVMFEMLTGRLPFMGNDQQELALAHIRQPPPHIYDVNPQLPEQLDRIIQKVLAKEPAARYSMANQLERILINYRDQGLGKTSSQIVLAQAAGTTPEEADESAAVAAHTAETLAKIPKSPFASPDSPSYISPSQVNHPQAGEQNEANAPTITRNDAALPAYEMPPVPQANPGGLPRTDNLRDTGYYPAVDPPRLDVVTLLLGVIAFLAVVGMLILWVFVFQAYT
ncbi:MAG: protein kinase domain-containing protein [Anaerolineales bacterium]